MPNLIIGQGRTGSVNSCWWLSSWEVGKYETASQGARAQATLVSGGADKCTRRNSVGLGDWGQAPQVRRCLSLFHPTAVPVVLLCA